MAEEAKTLKEAQSSAKASTPAAPSNQAELEKRLREELEKRLRAELEAKIREELASGKTNPNYIEPGPRYRTLERCYLKDIQFEPLQEFTWHGAPGYYMVPLNDEAKKKMAESGLLNPDGTVRGQGNVLDAMTSIAPAK